MSKKTIRKAEVLKFIKQPSDNGRGVTLRDIMAEFGLSHGNASQHLKRLWRLRLIEAIEDRPDRFKYRLQQPESIMFVHFRLTSRGEERLRWYELNRR